MIILNLSEANSARRRIPFKAVDATDKVTPETGLTFAAGELKISKNGATEANVAGSVAEVARGLYYYQATAGELDTIGFFSVGINKTGVHPDFAVAQVIDNDLNGNLDANVIQISGSTTAAVTHEDVLVACHAGTVTTADVAATTTTFQATGLGEQTADHYNGRQVLFTSGVMGGSAGRITDYAWDAVNSQSMFTISAMQETVVHGTTFVVI